MDLIFSEQSSSFVTQNLMNKLKTQNISKIGSATFLYEQQ